jgi:nucleotide-binding universal stress UspA family protein
MIKKILVPYDGSKHSDKVLEYALNLADKWDAALEILTIVPEASYVYVYGTGIDCSICKAKKELVHNYQKTFNVEREGILSSALKMANEKYPNLDITSKMLVGRPSDKIVEESKKGNFDIIVMGNRGLGRIKGVILGSVSQRVSNDAECPVLIVK